MRPAPWSVKPYRQTMGDAAHRDTGRRRARAYAVVLIDRRRINSSDMTKKMNVTARL